MDPTKAPDNVTLGVNKQSFRRKDSRVNDDESNNLFNAQLSSKQSQRGLEKQFTCAFNEDDFDEMLGDVDGEPSAFLVAP